MCIRDREDSLGDLRNDLNSSNRDEILDQLQVVDDKLEEINEILQNILQTAGGMPAELDEEDLAEQQETLNDLLEETYGILDDLESVAGSDAAVSYTHLDVYKRQPPIPLRRRSQGSVLRMEKSTSSSMWWMPPRWSGIST